MISAHNVLYTMIYIFFIVTSVIFEMKCFVFNIKGVPQCWPWNVHVVAHEGKWIPHMSRTKQWMKKDTNCRPQIPVLRFVPLMHHQLYVSMLFFFFYSKYILNNYPESYSDSLFYKPIIWQFLWFYGLLFHCLWKVN